MSNTLGGKKLKKVINIPDKVHDVLVRYKRVTGRAISGMIIEALFKWLIHERLITTEITRIIQDPETKKYYKGDEIEESAEFVKFRIGNPEAVMYCDSESCEFDPTKDPRKDV